MAKNDNRPFFGLKCSECGKITRRPIEKNKKNTPDKMEMRKYCPKCRKTTVMTETKLGK